MRPSPLGSKLLSGYAIVFAGIAPAAIAIFGIYKGVDFILFPHVLLGLATTYFGVRVFLGDYSAVTVFAILVIIHYLGLTATNLWHYDSFPEDTRAAKMAIPRMLRGVLYAGVYAWYFLFRSKTAVGFRRGTRGS